VCSDDEKAKQVGRMVGKIPGARALNGGKTGEERAHRGIADAAADRIEHALQSSPPPDTFYRASLEVTPLVRRAFASQIANAGHWRLEQNPHRHPAKRALRVHPSENAKCCLASLAPRAPCAVSGRTPGGSGSQNSPTGRHQTTVIHRRSGSGRWV